MKIRFTALVLALVLILSLLSGCSEVVGEIAGNVAEAAKEELEKQIKATLAEYKVEVVEIKSAVGKLNNNSDSDLQFFCGVLVRSNSDAVPQGVTGALGKIFEEVGICSQTGSKIENDLLVNKTVSFNHTDYSSGDYFLIWAYIDSLTGDLFATQPAEGIG